MFRLSHFLGLTTDTREPLLNPPRQFILPFRCNERVLARHFKVAVAGDLGGLDRAAADFLTSGDVGAVGTGEVGTFILGDLVQRRRGSAHVQLIPARTPVQITTAPEHERRVPGDVYRSRSVPRTFGPADNTHRFSHFQAKGGRWMKPSRPLGIHHLDLVTNLLNGTRLPGPINPDLLLVVPSAAPEADWIALPVVSGGGR